MGHVVKGTVNNFGVKNVSTKKNEDPEILR